VLNACSIGILAFILLTAAQLSTLYYTVVTQNFLPLGQNLHVSITHCRGRGRVAAE